MRWSRGFGRGDGMFRRGDFVSIPSGRRSRRGSTSPSPVIRRRRRPLFQSLSQFGSYGFTGGLMKVFGGDLGSGRTGPSGHAGRLPLPVQRNLDRRRAIRLRVEHLPGPGRHRPHLQLRDPGRGPPHRPALRSCDLRAAAGAGFYRWNYKYKGKSLRDSRIRSTRRGPFDAGTQRFYRGISPGGYLGLEAERRLTRHVTLTRAAGALRPDRRQGAVQLSLRLRTTRSSAAPRRQLPLLPVRGDPLGAQGCEEDPARVGKEGADGRPRRRRK